MRNTGQQILYPYLTTNSLDKISDKYVGISWLDGGRDRNGVDCWGIIKMIYKDLLKIDLPEYHCMPNMSKKIRCHMKNASESICWIYSKYQGDLDIIAMGKGNYMHHVGISFANKVLHATRELGVVLQSKLIIKKTGYKIFGYYSYNHNV